MRDNEKHYDSANESQQFNEWDTLAGDANLDESTKKEIEDLQTKSKQREIIEHITAQIDMVDEIDSDEILEWITTVDSVDYAVKSRAVRRIKNQDAINRIAMNDSIHEDTRMMAVLCLEGHQDTLEQIALNCDKRIVRLASMQRVENQDLLKQIALNDPDQVIRESAQSRLEELRKSSEGL